MKDGLRTTIRAGLVPALAAGLRGMPGVNLDYLDTACLGFILDKGVQLSKAPTMQAPFVVALLTLLFATSHLGGVPNVLEIFKHDGGAFGRVLHNALGEDVIVVSASPKLFPAQLFEMSLGRASAFGLQLSFQAEGTSFLFFPSLVPQELPGGSDSRTIESQVYPYDGRGRGNGRLRDGDNDMQRIAAFAVAQISTTDLMPNVLKKVSRHRERQFNPSIHSSKTTGHGVPLDPGRTLVIADTSDLTVRATNRLESGNGLVLFLGFLNRLRVCLFLLDLPGERRLHGFSGFDTSGTDQLCRQVRVLGTKGIVGAFVQLHAIVTSRGKALMGYGIEASRMLLKSCLE